MENIEFFRVPDDYDCRDEDDRPLPEGWYYWTCFPGCLPEGDPIGPFPSLQAAEDDAEDQMMD